ncbi:YkgJ family cysteine cluster protein [Hydrogenophaga defluvii]|uniref:YkgJ family cysteine cluster protein n=1 Tax=Hydrogenophaga defluvii TaxID=249410 RepID=A0ABW2SDQ5_9BURK
MSNLVAPKAGEQYRVLAATTENLQRIQERWVGLKERVEHKMQALAGKSRAAEGRLVEQAARAASGSKRIFWLRKAADAMAATAGGLAACRQGCSHCCHIAVLVSRAEAQVIAKETGVALNPKAGKYTMHNASQGDATGAAKETFGKPCPFLRDQACSIYDSRPLTCRQLLNMDEDDLLCQLIEGSAPEVPYMNTLDHSVAAVAILGGHQDYDDIRNWFVSRAPT